MSKLSFVALSLQTTHLDPASVSKVSYVKLVDGNITRQDDTPIIPPTSKRKIVDEQSEHSPIPWPDALEKLGMMIGKLPIVSYYRDADKEIFHAASRQLNIEPPVLHWLDCRELARKLLPELPDVQLSTVLKTLELYDEYADSSAVAQTTQIVVALAERQGATTVAQLWDELYDHPEDFLGLDTTFEGAADSGSSTEDDAVIDAPLAAEMLPFAAAAGGSPSAEQESNAVGTEDSELSEQTAIDAVDPEVPEEPDTPEEQPTPQESGGSFHIAEEDSPVSPDATEEDVVDEPAAVSPIANADELPVFLQEPIHNDHADLEQEATETDTPVESAPELDTATSPGSLQDAHADRATEDAKDPAPASNEELSETPEAREPTSQQDVPQPLISTPVQPLTHATSHEEHVHLAAQAPDDPVADDHLQGSQPEEQPAFLKEPSPDELVHDIEDPAAEQDDPALADVAADTPQERADRSDLRERSVEETSALPTATPPVSVPGASAPSTSQTHTVQAVQISERPRAEASASRGSNVNQIFGFVGLFVFGVLTIIGVVLVVMAVMLFFTENSLMLETKIAGVILTLAITLLSLLMTNVSYRSFRKK